MYRVLIGITVMLISIQIAFAGNTIIIYGNPGCSCCTRLMKSLDEKGISYTFHNIKADSSKNIEACEKLARAGFPDTEWKTLPLVDVNGNIVFNCPDFSRIEMYLEK